MWAQWNRWQQEISINLHDFYSDSNICLTAAIKQMQIFHPCFGLTREVTRHGRTSFQRKSWANLGSQSAHLLARVSPCQRASATSLTPLIKRSIHALCFSTALHESPRSTPRSTPSPPNMEVIRFEWSPSKGAHDLEHKVECRCLLNTCIQLAMGSIRLSFRARMKGYFCSLNKCHSKSDQTMSWRERACSVL